MPLGLKSDLKGHYINVTLSRRTKELVHSPKQQQTSTDSCKVNMTHLYAIPKKRNAFSES